MVITNSPTHHRGKGLFISRKSSSQTCPVVLSAPETTFLRDVAHNKTAQATMPPKVMAVMYTDQKLLMKSLMFSPQSSCRGN